jgi:hypothetical protein
MRRRFHRPRAPGVSPEPAEQMSRRGSLSEIRPLTLPFTGVECQASRGAEVH